MRSEQASRAAIKQQFRELHNMTYELDCAGSPLIIRIFPPMDAASEVWKIEVRASDAADAVVASASDPSRSVAFEKVAQWWRENAAARALGVFDWAAIAQAMTAVRAL